MSNVMTTTYFISTGLTTIMLGVLGFFLRQFYMTVKELTKTVDKLNLVVSVEGERVNHMKEDFIKSIEDIEELNKSSHDHETRITVLEEKIR